MPDENKTEVPLIWTSKGNLPIADLEYRHGWNVSADEICFAEEYWLGDEMVKRAAHVYKPQGESITGAQAKLG